MSVYIPHKTIIVDVVHKDYYTDSSHFLISSFHRDQYNNLCAVQSEVSEDKILDLVDNCSDQMLFSCHAINGIYDICDKKILSTISDKPLSPNKAYNQDLSKFLDINSTAINYTRNNIISLPEKVINSRYKLGSRYYIDELSKYLCKDNIYNKSCNLCIISMQNLLQLSDLTKNKFVITKASTSETKFRTCETDLYGSVLGLIFLSPFCNKVSTDYKDDGKLMNNFSKYMIHTKNSDLKDCIINRSINSIQNFDYSTNQHKNLSLSIIAAYSLLNRYSLYEKTLEIYYKVHNNISNLSDQYFIELAKVISQSIWISLTLYNNSDFISTYLTTNRLDINNLISSSYKSISKYKEIILKKDNNNSLKQEMINILSAKIMYHLNRLYSGNMFIKSSNLSSEVSLALLLTHCSYTQFSLFLKKLLYNIMIYNPHCKLEKIKFNYLKSMFLKYVNNDPICMIYTRIEEIYNKHMKYSENIEDICKNESVNGSIIPYLTKKDKITFNNFILVSVSRYVMRSFSAILKATSNLSNLIYKYLVLFIYAFNTSFSIKINMEKSAV